MKKFRPLVMLLFLMTMFFINASGQVSNKKEQSPVALAKANTDSLVKETKIDSVAAKKAYAYFLDYQKEKMKLVLIEGESQELRNEKTSKLSQINLILDKHLSELLTDSQYKNAKCAKMEMDIVKMRKK